MEQKKIEKKQNKTAKRTKQNRKNQQYKLEQNISKEKKTEENRKNRTKQKIILVKTIFIVLKKNSMKIGLHNVKITKIFERFIKTTLPENWNASIKKFSRNISI